MFNRKLSLTMIVALAAALPPQAMATQVNVVSLEKGKQLVHHHRFAESYQHFKEMATSGCPYSQCILGVMHSKGIGVKKDDKTAVFWFQKAADQGLADAKRWLGTAYAEGRGVAKDTRKAEYYLKSAAASGIREAKIELAHLYRETGLPEDVQKAKNVLASLEQSSAGSSEAAQQRLTATSYESNDNAFSSGLRGLTQSWGGYVSVVKSLQSEIPSSQ